MELRSERHMKINIFISSFISFAVVALLGQLDERTGSTNDEVEKSAEIFHFFLFFFYVVEVSMIKDMRQTHKRQLLRQESIKY